MTYEVQRLTTDGKRWVLGETEDPRAEKFMADWFNLPDTVEVLVHNAETSYTHRQRHADRWDALYPPATVPELDDGGDAFPMPGKCGPRMEYQWGDGKTTSVGGPRPGMSFRDWLAGQVIPQILECGFRDPAGASEQARIGGFDRMEDFHAHNAYIIADAMIRAKRRTEAGR